jgi:hypothetical protein
MDPDGLLALLAAVVIVARRDASKGNLAARLWLAELEASRPRRVRVLS